MILKYTFLEGIQLLLKIFLLRIIEVTLIKMSISDKSLWHIFVQIIYLTLYILLDNKSL